MGGIPELVREGRTGLLFDPGDEAGLASAMAGLATGGITLPGLAESSWDLARAHTVEHMTDNYLAQYDRLAAEAAS
jgi:glycosyltransferase involved in cell wall biosynthesis